MGSYVPNTSRRVLGILFFLGGGRSLFLAAAASSFFPRFSVFIFFRPDFFRFLVFGSFFILTHRTLCPEDKQSKKKKKIILWYGGAASSFFPIFSVFIIFSTRFFSNCIIGVIFVFQGIKCCAQRTEDRSREGPYTFCPPPWCPPPRSPPPSGGGADKFPGFGSRVAEGKGEGKQRCSNTPQDPGGVGGLVRAGNIVIVRFSASCGNQIELMSAT